MNGKYKDELELIMNMYRSGKITGDQKDELVAALDKRSGRDRARDCKKIVFRVITEKRTDAAIIVSVLSAVVGVDSVAFDERNSLATVIGEFDVDGIITAARDADIRLRVRDIDIDYVPEPRLQKEAKSEAAETPVERAAAETLETREETEICETLETPDETEKEIFADDDDDDDDDFDDGFDDGDYDETETESDNVENAERVEQEQDDVTIHINDSRSLSEFLKGLGARISDAFDAGVKTLQSDEFGKKITDAVDGGMKAAKDAGKKIADFADNVVIKTCDLGKRGVVVKTKAERYDVPYSETEATVKIVTDTDVVVFSGDANTVKAQSKPYLPDDMYYALCKMLDSEFTGRYKYAGNDTVLKLSVKPKKN